MRNIQAFRFSPSDRIAVIQHHRWKRKSRSDIRFSFIIFLSSLISNTGNSFVPSAGMIFDDLEAPLWNSSLISLDERTSFMSHFCDVRILLSFSLAPFSSLAFSYQPSSVLINSFTKALSFHTKSCSSCSQTWHCSISCSTASAAILHGNSNRELNFA